MTIARRPQKVFFTIKGKLSGWTLLELILGVVIFALVGLILFQVLVNGVETYKRAQFTTKTYIQMFKVFDALDHDLASAMKFNYSAVDSLWQSFSGDGKSMRLVVRNDGGLREVHYVLELMADGTYVLNREGLPLMAKLRHQTIALSVVTLAKHLIVEGFELSFGKKVATGEVKLEWSREWKADGLPEAVKVTLKCVPYSPRQAPLEFNRIFYLQNH